MAFLKHLQHDIFVSYAHDDDLPDREGEKGWVEEFERQLAVRLLKRFGEAVDLWRDPRLGRAELFDQVIEEALGESGVLISLISPRYLKRDYCLRELKQFQGKASRETAGFVVGKFLRIFPVLLYNVPPEEWPEPCRGSSAFKFHDGEGSDFGAPLHPRSDAFQQQLRRLVEELHTILHRLQDASVANQIRPGRTDPAPQKPAFRIFLAQSPEDLGPIRRQLAQALQGRGLEVINPIPPPYEEADHTQAVQQAVTEADLSIHLLSTRPGEALDANDPGRTYPVEQARLGLEHARSQIILLPDEFDAKNVDQPAYAGFLQGLKEKERDATRLEVVQTGRHQMLDEITAKLRKIEEAAARQAGADAASPPTAFIDLHTHDVAQAADLVDYLAQKNITPVMIPSADLSPVAGLSLFEETLRKAWLFLVVFGTAARDWVQYRLLEANKLILLNQLPTKIGVYVVPPTKPSTQLNFPYDVVINTDHFDPIGLDRLLQKTTAAAP